MARIRGVCYQINDSVDEMRCRRGWSAFFDAIGRYVFINQLNILTMKKLFLMCAALFTLAAVSFTSCNKDDDDSLESFTVQFTSTVNVDYSQFPEEQRAEVKAAIEQLKAKLAQMDLSKTFTATRSEAKSQFSVAVIKYDSTFQSVADECWTKYKVDFQIIMKMTSGNELVESRTWSHH